MTHRYGRPAPRRGFTLVELLVVIAIIGILVGLTAAAVMRMLTARETIIVRSDISQMSTAIGSFQQKFNVYPPSKVFLANSKSAYSASPETQASLKYLMKMWPKLNPDLPGFDWSGGRGLSGGIWLEGDQCLVFFLGGIPANTTEPGTLGFNSSPTNPTAAGGSRIPPFYNFDSSRLKARGAFYSYLDPWKKKEYAYFSSGLVDNGYNPNDCATIGARPYSQATGRYHLSSSFQIQSAGPDALFGGGGNWSSSAAGSIDANGRDDFTNIHSKQMGIP